MKIFLVTLFTILSINATNAQDPITAVIKAGIKKAIIAVDLKIQRLQTKTIWLQNIQKEIENTMSELKLNDITGWVQKQKDLYQNYFDELWKVKNIITLYHRVKDITTQQLDIVKEYHKGWNAVVNDGHFAASEIKYISNVYTGIIDASIKNLDQVAFVIHSFSTQMTDAKRLDIINTCAASIQKNLDDLKSFNNQNFTLSLQRSKDNNDVNVIKNLYQLN